MAMPKTFGELPVAVQGGVYALIAVALAGAVFYFLVLPVQQTRNALLEKTEKLKVENLRNQSIERERAAYLNRIAELEKQLEALRSIVPEEQSTDDFLKTVFADAKVADVNIRTFMPQTLVQKDIYTEMPFNLRLDGTYYGLLAFFDHLAREQRIVSVSGLALGSPAGGGMGVYNLGAGETVGANCVVTTYFNRVPTEAPPAPKR